MKQIVWNGLLCSLGLLLSLNAWAERDGLYLSAGLGLHTGNYEETHDGDSLFDDACGGLLSSFKIGAYLTPQLALYYQRDAAWLYERVSTSSSDSRALVNLGITGAGLSYYLSPAQGSTYLEVAAGLGDRTFISGEQKDSYGAALLLGGGIEAGRHLQFGLMLMHVSASKGNFESGASILAGKVELKL